jgi:hypothetical protein
MPTGYYSLEAWLNSVVGNGARASVSQIQLNIVVSSDEDMGVIAPILLARRNPTGITGAVAVADPVCLEDLLYLLAGSSDNYAAHIMSLDTAEYSYSGVKSRQIRSTLNIPPKWREEVGILESDEDKAEATPLRSQLLLVVLNQTDPANAKYVAVSGYVDIRYTTGTQSSYAFQSLLEGVD